MVLARKTNTHSGNPVKKTVLAQKKRGYLCEKNWRKQNPVEKAVLAKKKQRYLCEKDWRYQTAIAKGLKKKERHQASKSHCARGDFNSRDWLEDDSLDWLQQHLGKSRERVLSLVQKLAHPIFLTQIPGVACNCPSDLMLKRAKRTVVRFFKEQQALGTRSIVYKAFLIASEEKELVFDWDKSIRRVKEAFYDKKYQIDDWEDVYAMACGPTRSHIRIVVCGSRPLTCTALTALLCHEGMHCLAKRTRPGQVFLSDDIEHVAMALLGDPQIWVD